MTSDFSEAFLEIWRQALLDEADTVKLGSQSKAKRLRQVEFVFEGKAIIGIQRRETFSVRLVLDI